MQSVAAGDSFGGFSTQLHGLLGKSQDPVMEGEGPRVTCSSDALSKARSALMSSTGLSYEHEGVAPEVR